MALIIEDGTGNNPLANSYTTVESLNDYAQTMGVDLSALTDTACEVLLMQAMDYLEAKRDRYQGRKTHPEQPLQWPRAGVLVDGYPVAVQALPRELHQAQLALAIIAKDQTLMPNTTVEKAPAVIREQLTGVVEIEYATPSNTPDSPIWSKPESLLKPLYKRGGTFLERT